MTSLRSVSAAAILIPAGLATATLIPAPSHHSAAVSSPAPVAVATEAPRPSLTPTPSASSVLPSVWPSSTHAPAATIAPLSPDIAEAATTFARGWLVRDPAARKVALVQVAASTLLGSLIAMRPNQIPATTVAGPPTFAGATADGPLIDVPLADHTVVHLTLVPEPTAATGWLITAIKH